MAENLGEAVLTLSTDSSKLNSGLGAAQSSLGNLVSDFGMAGLTLSTAFSVPLGAIAALGIGFNAMQEQATIAFTTMLGSGEKATAFLDELKDFAASTPFEFPDLVRASQRLMAMGFEADKVRPMLTSIGDAAAALGGGAETINGLTTALGQMRAKGLVSAQEMNQLIERGIPAWDILATKIGVDVPTAMEMVSDKAVDATFAVDALTQGMDERFGGMMRAQSATFSGVISTIKDTLSFMAADALMPLFESLRDKLKAFVDVLPAAQEWLENLSPEVKNAAVAFGAVLALAGPVALGIAGITAVVLALASPFGIAVLAVGAFAAAMAAFPRFRGVVIDVLRSIVGAIALVGSQFRSIALAVSQLVSGEFTESFNTLRTMGDRSMTAMTEGMDMVDKGVNMLGGSVAKTTTVLKQKDAAVTAVIPGLQALGGASEGASKEQKKLSEEVDKITNSILGVKEPSAAWFTALHGLHDSGRMTTEALIGLKNEIGNLKISTDPVIAQYKELIPLLGLAKDAYTNQADTAKALALVKVDLKQKTLELKPALEAIGATPLMTVPPPDIGYYQMQRTLDLIGKSTLPQMKHEIEVINPKLVTMGHTVGQDIGGAFNSLKETVSTAFLNMFQTGELNFGNLGKSIKGIFQGLWTDILSTLTAMFLTPLTTAVTDAFNNLFKGVLEGAGFNSLISGLGSKIGGIFKSIFGGGSSAAGSVVGGVAGAGGQAAAGAASAGADIASGGLSALASGIGAFGGTLIAGLITGSGGKDKQIEENTRRTHILLTDLIEQLMWPIHDWTGWIAEQMTTLGVHLIPAIEFWNNEVKLSVNAMQTGVTVAVEGGATRIVTAVREEAALGRVEEKETREVLRRSFIEAIRATPIAVTGFISQ